MSFSRAAPSRRFRAGGGEGGAHGRGRRSSTAGGEDPPLLKVWHPRLLAGDGGSLLLRNEDRFGLAQLHQLRGRVGRGASKSYCLLSHQNKNKLSRQRLEVLVNSNDGFEISEIDLRFRGPGQVLGTKQSGLPDFALASLANDADLLELARNEARNILDADPVLTKNSMLRLLIKEQWEKLKIGNKLN